MDNALHIIFRQALEIQSADPGHGLGFQDHLSEMTYTRLLPKMEALFDQHADQEHYLRIDHLEIDAGTLDAAHWEEELERAVLKKLDLSLRQAQKYGTVPGAADQQQTVARGDIRERAWTAFLYFLQQGTLPWYADHKSMRELETGILAWWKTAKQDSHTIEQFRNLLKQDTSALRRLCLQSSDELMEALLLGIIKEKPDLSALKVETGAVLESLELKLSKERVRELSRLLIWKPILDNAPFMVTHDKRKNNLRAEILRNLTPEEYARYPDQAKNKRVPAEIVQEKKAGKPQIEDKPGYFIENAGLVILHPFLQELFQRLGLLKELTFKNKASQQHALMLTHYLVTGQDETAEFTLALNKLLCGYPMEDSLPGEIKIKEKEKAEADLLLQTVINQWTMHDTPVNTSVAGLRSSFLRRPGKLSGVQNGRLLRVEQHSYDIVLNSLPWGIGVIKLPWMEDMLMVEWHG